MSGCFASFFHHKRRLRALSIDGQAWFVVRDLGKSMNAWLGKRAVRDLDDVGRRHFTSSPSRTRGPGNTGA